MKNCNAPKNQTTSRILPSACATALAAAFAIALPQPAYADDLTPPPMPDKLKVEEGNEVFLVGHGVGRSYHEDPQIPNFGPPGRGPLLGEGMTLAIEPMINAGGPDVYLHDDQWSISTADGSLSVHFEHTVAITETGPRILTAAPVLLR